MESVPFQREVEVGIEKFANSDENAVGFSGIIKHKCSDFKVFEISKEGVVVRPSDQLMDEKLSALLESSDNIKTKSEDVSIFSEEEVLNSDLAKVISSKDFLLNLILFAQNNLPDTSEMITEVISDKQSRTEVHKGIRLVFKGILQSESRGDNCIRIYRKKVVLGEGGKSDKRDDRNTQPQDHCRFISFILKKENMDTIEAIQLITKRLHMGAKEFSYAGTKDRRGITCQTVIARNVTPRKITGINKLLEGVEAGGRSLSVSGLQIANGPLSLGELGGNRFELIIRNIEGANDEQLERALQKFGKDGFINYFGLQRFGQSNPSSHEIGKVLLRGEWEKAVELILGPRPGEPDQKAAEARSHWKQNGCAKEAQAMFPSRYTAERQILNHLSRDSNDYLGAILAINRELRLMYVHAVQSYIWNKMASLRIAKYGLRLVVGDLVLDEAEGGEQVVVKVTEDNNCYSISQLVLPLPGYNTLYPSQSELAEQHKQLIHEFGLDNRAMTKPKQSALWDLPGTYRKVLVIPTNLEHSIFRYNDPDADNVLESNNEREREGLYRGLFLGFSLPPSAYATMALRELMRLDTDPELHKSRTKKHKQNPTS